MDYRNHLIQSLSLNMDILRRFVSQIPEIKLHLRRGERFWTIYEHVHHLALVQPMLFRRIRQFVKEEHPVIHAFTPNPEEDKKQDAHLKPVHELLESFASWREKQVDLIQSCNEDVWKRVGEHPEYDQYPFETLILHILAHDGFHLYRMEELWLVKDGSLSKL
ncbi:DinB family protein [candidate division KSB1 bacterium]|nr:DinB family protein [candidate division KSB1 bacterium]